MHWDPLERRLERTAGLMLRLNTITTQTRGCVSRVTEPPLGFPVTYCIVGIVLCPASAIYSAHGHVLNVKVHCRCGHARR